MSRVEFYLEKESEWFKDNSIWKKKGLTRISQGNCYFASCLSALPLGEAVEFKLQLEKLAELVKNSGWFAVVPHRDTDPERDLDICASAVYDIDKRKIYKANLIIADFSHPSTGLGIELEIAHNERIPVIGMCKTNSSVSRMALGSPVLVAFFEYENKKDAGRKLNKILENYR